MKIRMYRFAAYPVTQYYVIGREIRDDSLESEGGSGTTYIIQSGPVIKPTKDWR